MTKTIRSIDSAIIMNNGEFPTIIWVIGLIIDDIKYNPNPIIRI